MYFIFCEVTLKKIDNLIFTLLIDQILTHFGPFITKLLYNFRRKSA